MKRYGTTIHRHAVGWSFCVEMDLLFEVLEDIGDYYKIKPIAVDGMQVKWWWRFDIFSCYKGESLSSIKSGLPTFLSKKGFSAEEEEIKLLEEFDLRLMR